MRKERNEKQTAANEVASVRETSVAATQYVERKDAEREQTLVSEINLITEQTKQALLTGTIEIGKRLTEAKCLVRHGEWGNWLAERVNYSQRSANNFMKIYKEYGATGLAAKSQSIANLSVTQAVAMFDLPAEERERFAEQNEADKMSIRQLKAEVAKAKEELEAEKSSTKEALEQCKKNHEAEIAHYKQMTQSAVSKREEIEAQLKAERKHLEELSASQDEKAKEQVEAAIAEQKAELVRTNEEVDALQAELAKLNGKHKEELEAVRKEQGRKLEAELKAKDEEIAGSKKRLEEALTQSTKELSATKKSLDTEKSKNAEMATLGKATYAMDQLLKSYEELMDIVASVGSFDKVAANKMMIEISKSMATVEKKCKKKLTA